MDAILLGRWFQRDEFGEVADGFLLGGGGYSRGGRGDNPTQDPL
jgi:hypothetical protein